MRRLVIANASSKYGACKDFPWEDVATAKGIVKTVESTPLTPLWKREYRYLKTESQSTKTAKAIVSVYRELTCN
jgi:hypothetical protein